MSTKLCLKKSSKLENMTPKRKEMKKLKNKLYNFKFYLNFTIKAQTNHKNGYNKFIYSLTLKCCGIIPPYVSQNNSKIKNLGFYQLTHKTY